MSIVGIGRFSHLWRDDEIDFENLWTPISGAFRKLECVIFKGWRTIAPSPDSDYSLGPGSRREKDMDQEFEALWENSDTVGYVQHG
jgi:hypothetical protein